LKIVVAEISQLKGIKDVRSYILSEDHQNQPSWLSCLECQPFPVDLYPSDDDFAQSLSTLVQESLDITKDYFLIVNRSKALSEFAHNDNAVDNLLVMNRKRELQGSCDCTCTKK